MVRLLLFLIILPIICFASGTEYMQPEGGGAVTSVNGQTGDVVLDTDNISEGAINLYFTEARARLAAVADSITDGVTNIAPSQNAVFDALALKQDVISGTPETLAWFNSSGDIESLLQWSVDPVYQSLSSIVSIPGTDTRSDSWQLRTQTNLNGDVTSTARSLWLSLQGNGNIQGVNGIQLDVGVPVTGDLNLTSLASGNSSTVGGNLTGLGIYTDSPVTGNSNSINISSTNTIGGSYNGIFVNNGSTVSGFNTLYSGSMYGDSLSGGNLLNLQNSGASTGNFRLGVFNNNGTIDGFGSGVSVTQSGAVTKGWDAYSAFIGADIGDGTGVSLSGLNLQLANTITLDGSLFGLYVGNQADVTGQIVGVNLSNNADYSGLSGINVFNQGPMVGDFTYYAVNSQNDGDGYRHGGIYLGNTGDMTEEVRGFAFNDNSDARTKTGIDINMQGNATDDAQALRINVQNQTSSSTSQHVQAITTTGGVVNFNSLWTPFSGFGVDVGNVMSINTEIASGSPLTGTDMILSLNQPRLQVNDTISTGPFGLDTNFFGYAPQITVGSGITVPKIRTMLLGATIPSGSGGTINEYIGLELLGIPSFGGSATIPTKIGLLDSNLVGQNFCDGATDCWFIKNQDSNSENHLSKLAINTSSKKVSTNVKLEVNEGHTKFSGTSATCTVNSNAGTGATCSVDGNDTIGRLTLTTGSGSWASGEQVTLDFAVNYNSTPICILTPADEDSAMASLNTYAQFGSVSSQPVSFVNPEVASTEYIWSYQCYEK